MQRWETLVIPASCALLIGPPHVAMTSNGDYVLQNFRQDWERLHLLEITDGVSITTLTLLGLSRLFEERGLPGFVVVSGG